MKGLVMSELVDGEPGSWRQLLSGSNLPVIVVLAGGVALYAINVYLASSLLPSAIVEIGGERFYAWNTTVFLLASVASSVLVTRAIEVLGGRHAYLIALGLFGLGSVVCSLAPSMAVLLVGRGVQGVGGGLLAGLAYGMIQSSLPEPVWSRAVAMTSAMWGVGTLIGPALGGALAEFASWRIAFGTLVVACSTLAVIVPRALSRGRPQAGAEPVPMVSVVIVMLAALVVSVVSVVGTPWLSAIGVVIGVVLLGAFLRHERRTRSGRVLPASMFRARSPLGWIYLTLALLAMGSQIEGFVPLFGQRLAGLAPLAAAFLGAVSAAGWALAQIVSSNADAPRSADRLSIAGPAALTAGLLACTFLVHDNISGIGLIVWIVALLIAGAGIGLAWPHLSTAVLRVGGQYGDGAKAAAAINSIQLLANAFGAAFTGVLVNLASTDAGSARLLFLGVAVLTALGIVTAFRATSADTTTSADGG
ncbi:MFS transporter [Pseudonocardia phyllosphaerae]|uniref:MFS transporter n=1 Tax=Pseudonocardia phyllosphaerae TaxID=3390502 RepID=UPI00397AFDB0